MVKGAHAYNRSKVRKCIGTVACSMICSLKLQDHGNLPLYSFVNPWLVLLARLSHGRRESGQISIIVLCLTTEEFRWCVNWGSDEQRHVVDLVCRVIA